MFSKRNGNFVVKWLGYPMGILFFISFIFSFFQKIDVAAIFAAVTLVSICLGLLYSRKYAYSGSNFWYYYQLGALISLVLVSFGFLFWGTAATAILIYPYLFFGSSYGIMSLVKSKPRNKGASPHKTLFLFLTFTPLSFMLIAVWAVALFKKY